MAVSTKTTVDLDDAAYQENISRMVRLLMVRDGLEQRELGERMGINQTNVSARLRGQNPWTLKDLVRLGAIFDVHPVVLLLADPKDFRPSLTEALSRAETVFNSVYAPPVAA